MTSAIPTPTFQAKAGNIFNADGVTQFYAEGTWTPVLTSSVGTITAYSGSGKYTRVGNMVTCACQCSITDVGSGSGVLYVSLPITPASGYIGACSGVLANNAKALSVQIPATTYLVVSLHDATSVVGNLTFRFTVTYFV